MIVELFAWSVAVVMIAGLAAVATLITIGAGPILKAAAVVGVAADRIDAWRHRRMERHHWQLWREYVVNTAEGTRMPNREDAPTLHRVAEHVEHVGVVTPMIVAEAFGVSRQRAHQLLARLAELGRVRHVRGGRYETIAERDHDQNGTVPF